MVVPGSLRCTHALPFSSQIPALSVELFLLGVGGCHRGCSESLQCGLSRGNRQGGRSGRCLVTEPRRPQRVSGEPSLAPPPSCQRALPAVSHHQRPGKAPDPGGLPTPGHHLATPLTLMGFSVCSSALTCGSAQLLFHTPKSGPLGFTKPLSLLHRNEFRSEITFVSPICS